MNYFWRKQAVVVVVIVILHRRDNHGVGNLLWGEGTRARSAVVVGRGRVRAGEVSSNMGCICRLIRSAALVRRVVEVRVWGEWLLLLLWGRIGTVVVHNFFIRRRIASGI